MLILLKKVCYLSLSILFGRFANILIPFSLIYFLGINSKTDFVLIALSSSFYFYGTLFNALLESAVPRLLLNNQLITGRLLGIISLAGFSLTFLLLVFYRSYVDPVEFILIGLCLSGSSLCGVLAIRGATILHAYARYNLANLLWALRLLPLLVFALPSEYHAYLLIAFSLLIFAADTIRLVVINHYASQFGHNNLPGNKAVPLDKNVWAFVIASLIHGLSPLIDRLVVSFGDSGNITILDTGERIYNIIVTAISSGLMGVMLVEMSNKFKTKNFKRYWRNLLGVSFAVGILGILIASAVSYIIRSPYIISFADNISEHELLHISYSVLLYSSAIPAIIVSGICSKVLLIQGSYYLILKLAIFAFALNLCASVWLFQVVGLLGVVFATSATNIVVTIVLLILSTKIIYNSSKPSSAIIEDN